MAAVVGAFRLPHRIWLYAIRIAFIVRAARRIGIKLKNGQQQARKVEEDCALSFLEDAGRGTLRWFTAGMARGMIAARAAVPRKTPLADAGAPGLTPFLRWAESLEGTVLELGTRRVLGQPPTLRRGWAPKARYIACDFQSGDDVDVVADVESLSSTFEAGSIDAVIAISVFEHIRRPWLAAAEIAKVLRVGGRAFVLTHNCFPIHAHPFDYWRFTREALETLFCSEYGFVNQASWYEYPAVIVSSREPLTAFHGAFLNVGLVAERA